LGKKANCQVAASVHSVSHEGRYPLDLQLDLPDSWLADTERLDETGVPQDQRHARTKHESALELLDRVRSEGLPGGSVVADAGYGVSREFRDALEQRQLEYIVGVTSDVVVFAQEPEWDRPDAGKASPGRPRKRA
jgi:SRSO17 transposase